MELTGHLLYHTLIYDEYAALGFSNEDVFGRGEEGRNPQPPPIAVSSLAGPCMIVHECTCCLEL